MHEAEGQMNGPARCPARPCDRGEAAILQFGQDTTPHAWFPMHAIASKDILVSWVVTTMAFLYIQTARAEPGPQCETDDQPMWLLAVHAAPCCLAALCTQYLNCRAKRACNLSTMHMWVMILLWVDVICAVSVSAFYIATGKREMFGLMMESGTAATSILLIFQLFNGLTPDTRRGHVIATWLRHGVEKSWGNSEEVLAKVNNSLEKVRSITTQYHEATLEQAALNTAPLEWDIDVLGKEVWLEMQQTAVDPEKWRGVDEVDRIEVQGKLLYDDVGHCVKALHQNLSIEWKVLQENIFPRLWILASRKKEIRERVKQIKKRQKEGQLVQHFGCGRLWKYLCMVLLYISQVLCRGDDSIQEYEHEGAQCLLDVDSHYSPVCQVVFFLNIVVFMLMASQPGAFHYVLGLLLAVSHLALPLLGGIPSLVISVLLLVITCGRIAPPPQDASIRWSEITINRRPDETIDPHDEMLVSLAMLHRKGELTVHVRDIHKVKRHIADCFGNGCMDQVRGALERAERKVSGEVKAAAGSGPANVVSIAMAELEDLQKQKDFDRDAYESLMSEVQNLVKKGTPMPTPCGQDAGDLGDERSGDGGTESGRGSGTAKNA